MEYCCSAKYMYNCMVYHGGPGSDELTLCMHGSNNCTNHANVGVVCGGIHKVKGQWPPCVYLAYSDYVSTHI